MKGLKKAITIGTLCVGAYVINYYLRNMLSVFTPILTQNGTHAEAHLALLSSIYMIFYAGGQLVNGFLGDIFSPKKLIFTGLLLGGCATAAFPFVTSPAAQMPLFALLGFALSMMRGPLMKTITENTTAKAARLICVFFSFASFAGPLIAGLFAIFFDFTLGYVIAGGLALACGIALLSVLVVLERRGDITYHPRERVALSSLLSVFKIEKFAFYLVVACIVEIGAASISFWIPTFLTDKLSFGTDASSLIFSGISIARSFMPFLALFIFNLIGERDILMMRVAFSISSLMFLLTLFAAQPWVSIVFLMLALMALSCTSSLLWSIYIPGLGKTGRVSSVNGVLDCAGYIAAAAANLLFSAIKNSIGWSGVLMIWMSLGLIGIFATLFVKKKRAVA